MPNRENTVSEGAIAELAGHGLHVLSLFRGSPGPGQVVLCAEIGSVQPTRAAVVEGDVVKILFPPLRFNRVCWAENRSLLVNRYLPVLRTAEAPGDDVPAELEFAVLDIESLEERVIFRTEYALWKLIVDGPAVRAGVEQKSYYGSDAYIFEFHTGRMIRIWGTDEADVYQTFDGDDGVERESNVSSVVGDEFFNELTALIHFDPGDDEGFWTYGWWKAKS